MFDAQVRRISEHVYLMKAGKPDRPSLCAVVGAERTLMLDSGASDEHARLFLTGLAAHGIRTPDFIALTHWHWDHVFGAAEIDAPVIANYRTAVELSKMAVQDWSDAALDGRVESGEEIAFCADNIKLELPAPRHVRIKPATILYDRALSLDLGGVTCQLEHVGGDHAADSCVAFVPEDGVLFMGDCHYDNLYSPMPHYTPTIFTLLERLKTFNAALYIEGHNPDTLDAAGFHALCGKIRSAADHINRQEGHLDALRAENPSLFDDEDMDYYLTAFANGWALNHP